MIRSRGFTLIELLVVIAIIGLLSSVVLASLNTARGKARDAKRMAELDQLQLALEMYYDTVGSYPAYSTSVVNPDLNPLVPTYIGTLPADPVHTGGTGYRYCMSGGDYILLAYKDNPVGWCGKGRGTPCGWQVYLPGGSSSSCR